MQQKARLPVQFETTQQTGKAVMVLIDQQHIKYNDELKTVKLS